MIPAQNAKTMEAFNKSINSFTDGFKAYAKSADQAGGAAITRAHEALPGVAKKGIQTAKLTGSDMNQAVFEGSPLGTAIGESAMSMGKAFLGMDEKKEDDSTVISSTEGAGESISEQSDALDDIKHLLSNIDVGIDSLVNLSSEMLAVWVDASEMERIMHEELMSESAADRLRSIEQERERKSSSKIVPEGAGAEGSAAMDGDGPGILGAFANIFQSFFKGKFITKLFGILGSVFTGLISMAKAIPGLVQKMMPWLKSGGKFFAQVFKKILFPITILMAIFDFAKGFAEGYEEGGVIEGLKQGMQNVIKNLIDVPLNMLKGVLSWVLEKFGLSDEAEAVDSFEFDFAGMYGKLFDAVVGIYTSIWNALVETFTNLGSGIKDAAKKGWEGIKSFFGGKDEEDKPTPASAPAAPEVEASEESESVDATEPPVPLYQRRKAFKKARKQKKIEGIKSSISDLESSKSDIERRVGVLREGIEGGDDSEQTRKNLENLIKNAAEYDKLIAERQSKLEQLTGGDPRAGAAAAIQDAGVSSGMAGGGAAPTVIIDQKDQSVSQAASNLIPMPFTTQTDPAMSQSANVDL